MPGVKALRKIQIGQETTAGTAVVATTIWRGEGVLQDEPRLSFRRRTSGCMRRRIGPTSRRSARR